MRVVLVPTVYSQALESKRAGLVQCCFALQAQSSWQSSFSVQLMADPLDQSSHCTGRLTLVMEEKATDERLGAPSCCTRVVSHHVSRFARQNLREIRSSHCSSNDPCRTPPLSLCEISL